MSPEKDSSILPNTYSSDAIFLWNQWQFIVFFRHPVASEVEVEPNYSQEYQVSQKLIAASKAASEAVTAAAYYISNTNITTNEALKFEILALIVICLPAYLGISEFDTKFWHKL